ncbi:MAG: F0F1 ATP synthase subunit B [Betaproteobacteria bacterium AqS2]|uniref:ATP synthase subunit b n=1 Tax=Candidatus Amphirhobacter heronislandensis TaxID=1732024 RepID=A0A930UBP0_9GAMM|nr:F0F1 ATP synthase subunit B [Betaproteobacteria bacterium AqS2]
MNINMSIIGQAITFGILIWFTMKYVWPPLLAAIEKRNKEIAAGLDAAAAGQAKLDQAQEEYDKLLGEGRAKRGEHLAEGKKRQDEIMARATEEAQAERDRIIEAGRSQIDDERKAMVRELQESYAVLVVEGARKIIRREIDPKAHEDIVADLVKKL